MAPARKGPGEDADFFTSQTTFNIDGENKPKKPGKKSRLSKIRSMP